MIETTRLRTIRITMDKMYCNLFDSEYCGASGFPSCCRYARG